MAKKQQDVAKNVLHVGTISQSAIQQGSPDATQTVTITQEVKNNLGNLIQKLSASIDDLGLDGSDKADLQANIKTIQDGLTKGVEPSIWRRSWNGVVETLKKCAIAAASSGASQLVTDLLEGIRDNLQLG